MLLHRGAEGWVWRVLVIRGLGTVRVPWEFPGSSSGAGCCCIEEPRVACRGCSSFVGRGLYEFRENSLAILRVQEVDRGAERAVPRLLVARAHSGRGDGLGLCDDVGRAESHV